MVDDLFLLTQQHLQQDGFTVETLMGFNPAGENVITFIASGGMDVERLSMLTPTATRVINRPLLTSGSLLAAGFALNNVRAAAYSGRVYLPESEEEFLVTVGVWPEKLFARAHALPVDVILASNTDIPTEVLSVPLTGQLQDDLLSLENWAVGLIPDVQVEGRYTNGHDA